MRFLYTPQTRGSSAGCDEVCTIADLAAEDGFSDCELLTVDIYDLRFVVSLLRDEQPRQLFD